MKKEEILAMSKKENKNCDCYEKEIDRKSGTYAGIAVVILAAVYFLIDLINGRNFNVQVYSIIALFDAIVYGYKSIKIEKNRVLNSITAVIWSILTVILILEYAKVI